MTALTSNDGWCILRTSGPKTLPLARALAEAGLSMWTPIEIISRRRPRSKIRDLREVPITPTYVFARAGDLPALRRFQALPVSPFPGFSILHSQAGIAIVADATIEHLRYAEAKADRVVRKAKRYAFPIGDQVRVQEGIAAGMTGIVRDGDGHFTLVDFGGSMRVKIASFLLGTNEVQDAQLNLSTAA